MFTVVTESADEMSNHECSSPGDAYANASARDAPENGNDFAVRNLLIDGRLGREGKKVGAGSAIHLEDGRLDDAAAARDAHNQTRRLVPIYLEAGPPLRPPVTVGSSQRRFFRRPFRLDSRNPVFDGEPRTSGGPLAASDALSAFALGGAPDNPWHDCVEGWSAIGK